MILVPQGPALDPKPHGALDEPTLVAAVVYEVADGVVWVRALSDFLVYYCGAWKFECDDVMREAAKYASG